MEYIKIQQNNNKKNKTGKYVKGSAAIEMSYIMPMFLFLFVLITHTVFYYHDKAVLNGAAAETAVLGTQMERKHGTEAYDLKEIFQERIKGKLIYMTNVKVSIRTEDDEIEIAAEAQRKGMKLDICQKAAVVKPEEKIRWMN